MFKRVMQLLAILLVVLALVLAVNMFRHRSRQLAVAAAAEIAVDARGVADRLAGAIRLRTMSSYDDSLLNAQEFLNLHAMLETSYPRTHETLTRDTLGLSLLYTWRGTDTSLAPVLFMAHQDVVPIAPGTEKDWLAEPFSGEQKDGFIWGRGAWDDKGNLIAQMEAVEILIKEGYQPARTIYFAYGADEEVGGERGAARIAAQFRARGVKFDFVLDEGMLIADGMLPGLSTPAALIGVAEKGSEMVQLRTTGTPGHSSMPQPRGDNAIARLSGVLTRIENEQMPAATKGVALEMFETLAPEMRGFNRVALSNLWLFGPMVQAQLVKNASTNAMLRTTTALTILQAGNKNNVIPAVAEATVNFRLLPGDTREKVLEHVKSKAGPGVEVTVAPSGTEASAVSSTTSASYQLINRTLRSLFPGTVVSPALMIGATDSRHFNALSANVYRFSPMKATPVDLERFHGTNERIAITNLVDLVRFYHAMLKGAGSPATTPQ